MKKIIQLALFLITSTNAFDLRAQTWVWGKGQTGNGGGEGNSIATDAAGNSYITGSISCDTCVFGADTISGSGYLSAFLAKYDATGDAKWVKVSGGSGITFGWDVATDNAGNIYVAGQFGANQIAFGTYTLTNASTSGGNNIFLVKYDSLGNVIWAKSAGGDNSDAALSVATDAVGNVFITGAYGSTRCIFGTDTLIDNNPSGHTNIFLTKYDASGNVLWAKSSSSISGSLNSAVATDASGNIYLTGGYNSARLAFDQDTLISSGGSDFFLAKFDAAGNTIWLNRAPTSAHNNDDWGYSVATDVSENVYVTGVFRSYNIYFGAYTLTNADNSFYPSDDVFLVKYNRNGNVLWAKSAGGTANDDGYSVSADPFGNLFMTGAFNSSSITLGSYTLHYPSFTTDPMFIAELDSSGNVLCASSLTSGGDDINGVATDNYGNAYICGDYASGPFVVGNETLNGSGETVFTAKFTCGFNAISEQSANESINIYPNPGYGSLTISCSKEIDEIIISDLFGRIITRLKPQRLATNLQLEDRGIYFAHIKSGAKTETKKIIVN